MGATESHVGVVSQTLVLAQGRKGGKEGRIEGEREGGRDRESSGWCYFPDALSLGISVTSQEASSPTDS